MPTNAAMNRWLQQHRIEPNAKRWDNRTVGHFKYVLKHMMVPWHTAHKRWPLYFSGCTLLGVTHNVTHPLEGMKLDLWGGKGPGLKGSLRSLPVKASRALRGLKSSKVQPQNYGIAGQGYNTLTGFPNSFSGGGVDPGFVGNAVFQVVPSLSQPQVTPVSKLPQGSCSTSFTSSTYSTASQLYSSSSTA